MHRLQELFAAACELPDTERDLFIDRSCGDASELAVELRQLLRADRMLAGAEPARPGKVGYEWIDAVTSSRLRPGARVGEYTLCEPIGAGGMGVVFRAERDIQGARQQVAIKVLRGGLLDPEVLRRFRIECQSLARLDHPYIAALLEQGVLDEGVPYLVLSYVRGLPITQYAEKHTLSVRARIELMRRVCQAVSHAHRYLVVHRDLKPANVLVEVNGLPKLLDFGIARLLPEESASQGDWTRTAHRCFSPAYAAPEQLRGEDSRVSSDVYSLGALLYELLAGVPALPLQGLSAGEAERLILEHTPTAPSVRISGQGTEAKSLKRSLKGDLDDIVLRCLRKRPEERYASVEQLDADLECFLQGRPVSARGSHRWYRARKFIARHRIAVTSVAAGLLGLSMATVVLWQQNRELRMQRDLSSSALGVLRSAFVAADPIRASGADVSAGRILDAAREQFDEIERDQPELFARLAGSVAEVDLSLGRFAQGVDLLERALAASAGGELSADELDGLRLQLARALLGSAEWERAGQLLATEVPADRIHHLDWLTTRGRQLAHSGNPDQALPLLERALALSSTRGPEDELATRVRYTLAEAHSVAKQTQQELAVLDETLAWQRQTLPDTHAQVLRTRMRRVAALRASDKTVEAVGEARASLGLIVRAFGPDSAEAIYGYNTLGRALEHNAQPDLALVEYRQALEAAKRGLGADHVSTQRIQFNVAHLLDKAGGHEAEAERLYRGALEASQDRGGAGSALSTYFRLHFARFLNGNGRAEEALQLLVHPEAAVGLANSSAFNRAEYLGTVGALTAALDCRPANTASGALSEVCERARRLLAASPAPSP
ncbi:MAG: serine/threonine protein kinase [Xanthomonadales bacterium]|nr:serine/threonine protein kinase [Xanthomonadales bacterium]